MATPDLQRLAAHVNQRRLDLNLSIKRAAAICKLSKDTWMRVENGEQVRHSTYDKVEKALGWTTGSCRKVLDGQAAALLDGVDFAAVPASTLEDEVRSAIQGAMVAGTDLNASIIRDVNERAIEALRSKGVLPPAE